MGKNLISPKLKFLRSPRGFSITEVMVGLLVISISAIAFETYVAQVSTANNQLNVLRNVLSLRNNIIQTLRSPSAWKNTVSQNQNMKCIGGGTSSCQAGQAQWTDFKLVDENNRDVTTNSIVKYKMSWSASCVTYPCSDPMILVQGTPEITDSKAKVVLNEKNYEIHLVVGETVSTIESACKTVGGVYDPSTLTCKPNYAGKKCPTGQYVQSIAQNGSITCAVPFSGRCPASQVLVGVKNNGTPICAAKYCPPPTTTTTTTVPPPTTTVPPMAGCPSSLVINWAGNNTAAYNSPGEGILPNGNPWCYYQVWHAGDLFCASVDKVTGQKWREGKCCGGWGTDAYMSAKYGADCKGFYPCRVFDYTCNYGLTASSHDVDGNYTCSGAPGDVFQCKGPPDCSKLPATDPRCQPVSGY